MEPSAAKTTPNQMGMGRPSDETLAGDDNERDFKSRIVPDDFGNFEKGPSIRILEDWLKHEAGTSFAQSISFSRNLPTR